MKNYKVVLGLLGTLCSLTLTTTIVETQEKNNQGTVQVHLVITNESVRGDTDVPTLQLMFTPNLKAWRPRVQDRLSMYWKQFW